MNLEINRLVFCLAVLSVGSTAAAPRLATAQADLPFETPVASTSTAQQFASADRTFELRVVPADGLGEFRECATFRTDHALVLQASQGLIIDWALETSDPALSSFHAVTDGRATADNPFRLALHGSFVGRDEIRGDAINDRGLTFVFSGRENRYCDLGPRRYAVGGPYDQAPLAPRIYEPSRNSVAGKLYIVRLYSADLGSACYNFVINGVLDVGAGSNLIWRMDRLDTLEPSFQAIAVGAGATGGLAMHGQLMSWGELRISGIESGPTGLRQWVGSARETDNCITE